ncbi:uncharacterized protein BDW43DRAFT_16365 [Aspergillus alliaceus]|uniref:uncharacterized protein n=1 Tax=Petromyces alliaceus TaxID=209559 RepID=UPI0012A7528F|nr:uncharacterized protein BDW43DRAFT_16365 [Aspergillus alliaceus]KAB8235954.1 hypothetical protein BDW43DRAFT_16365 [Aspergillus alliaceus]
MDDTKPRKVKYSWMEIMLLWAMDLYLLMYTNSLRFIIVQFLLTLTPTLWAPREWVATLSASISEQPVYIDDETMKAWSRLDSNGRCKT